jgi:hypothetical protein
MQMMKQEGLAGVTFWLGEERSEQTVERGKREFRR